METEYFYHQLQNCLLKKKTVSDKESDIGLHVKLMKMKTFMKYF